MSDRLYVWAHAYEGSGPGGSLKFPWSSSYRGHEHLIRVLRTEFGTSGKAVGLPSHWVISPPLGFISALDPTECIYTQKIS